MIQIEVGSLVFNSGTADGNGTMWYVTNMEGWESPAHRQTFGDVTGADGVVIGEAQFSSRTVVLEGVVKATSEANFWTAYNSFIQVTSVLLNEINLKVYEAATVKQMGVVRSEPPKIEFQGPGTFVFNLTLLAPYPVKLSGTETTTAYNGSISPNNTGSFQTFPVVVMTGAGAPVFTNTSYGSAGASVTFTTSLASGTTIDFRKKTVVGPTGTDLYSSINPTQTNWWSLLPGVNNLTRSGGGTSDIKYRIAWL